MTHYEALLTRLTACSARQKAVFMACSLQRGLRAFAAVWPGDPRLGVLEAGLDAILGQLRAGPATAETLEPFRQIAEEMLQPSAADGDDGEPKDRIAFYFAAAALLLPGVAAGRLTDPKHPALCASHVIHILEQAYDNDDIGGLEKRWQIGALDALLGGAESPDSLLALPDYDLGPVGRGRR